jgi:hypothetical protein
MVLIRGERNLKVSVYKGDSIGDVIDRVALALNTLPKYLHFDRIPSIETLVLDQNYAITTNDYNLYCAVDAKTTNISFKAFLHNKVVDKFTDLSVIDKLELWLYYKAGQLRGDNAFMYLLVIEEEYKELAGVDYKPSAATDFFKYRYRDFSSNLKQSLANLKETVEGRDSALKLFETTAAVRHEEFKVDTASYEVTLKTTEDLSVIFDSLILTSNAPFAVYKKFYKILENFQPPPNWVIDVADCIILKLKTRVKYGIRERVSIDKLFNNVAICQNPLTREVKIHYEIENRLNERERTEIIESVISMISLKERMVIDSIKQVGITGVYFIPMFSFNKFILADMIMNDKFFSQYLSIDESLHASKKRDNLYIHFTPRRGEETRCSLSTRVASKKEIEVKEFSRELFPYNVEYGRVKITMTKSVATANEFIATFQKFLGIYLENYEKVASVYRKYIPGFVEKREIKVKDVKITLKDIVPDLFLPGYARDCGNPPTIIPENQIREWSDRKDAVMLFPKSPKEGQQHYYTCLDNKDEYKYIGLKRNKLDNKQQYPYVPCCYKKDQSQTVNWKSYFAGKEQKKGEQQRVITTHKFVGFNEYGTLPENLDLLLQEMEAKREYSFYRLGMAPGQSSFLDCVLETIDEKYREYTAETRIDQLKKYREELSHWSALCRQTMYDSTESSIKQSIADENVYLDPKLYTNLLSEYFRCNIYTFTREYENDDATILVQRSKGCFYERYNPSRPNIIIYEHPGSESDHATTPRCELIVFTSKTSGDLRYIYTDEVNSQLQTVYRQLISSYDRENLPNKNTDVIFPIAENRLVSQVVDSAGKTRMIEIDTGYFIYTSPLSNLFCEVKDGELLNFFKNRYTLDRVRNLSSKYQIKLTGCYVLDDKVKEIRGKCGNVDMYFLMADGLTLSQVNLQTYSTPVFIETNTDSISQFRYARKLTKYLTQSLYYKFSLEAKDNNGVFPQPRKFISQSIIIKPTHSYPDAIPNKLKDNYGFVESGKVIVRYSHAASNLEFVLRLALERNPLYLKNFHEDDTVRDYYENVSDFKQVHGQIVLRGDAIIENWGISHNIPGIIYDQIKPDLAVYYFRNSNLENGRLYIANVRDTLEEGFKSIYNLDYIPEFTLCDTDYNMYTVTGDKKLPAKAEDLIVIAYKTKIDKDFFLKYAFLTPFL